jgi:hypothetical protein
VGLVVRIGEVRKVYNILVEKPEGKRPLGKSRRRWRIMLDWILEKYGGKMWTGFMWIRLGASGRLL